MCTELGLIIFVDILTIMSSCIRKQRKSSSMFKGALLSKVIVRSEEISICENCFKRGFRFYMVSLLDSVRYMKYVCSNRSRCDVLGLTVAQLEALSSIYVRLEAELEDAFEK